MISGGRRVKTPNQKLAMQRSAENRRCPKCKRSAGLGARVESYHGVHRTGSFRECRYCGHRCGIENGKPFGHTVGP